MLCVYVCLSFHPSIYSDSSEKWLIANYIYISVRCVLGMMPVFSNVDIVYHDALTYICTGKAIPII